MNINNIRSILRRNEVINYLYYNLGIDNVLYTFGFGKFGKKIETALRDNLTESEYADKALIDKIRKDIVNCYKRYKSNAAEFFLFDFRNKNDDERSQYVTDAYINSQLSFFVGRRKHDKQLNNKYNFYQLMKPFFKREVLFVDEHTSYADFKRFVLDVKHIIVKPNTASVGSGIFAAKVETEQDAEKLYEKLNLRAGGVVLEEIINQSLSMAKWNGSSVNTIRISSFLKQGKYHILSSILRTGRAGSVVDNAGRGGISAAIDPSSGVIISDGMDKSGNWYIAHPDSGVPYKDVQIEAWKELLVTAELIHRTMPEQIYVGWDFALTDEGWVLIEGNWGELGAQQVALGHGLKEKFDEYLFEK